MVVFQSREVEMNMKKLQLDGKHLTTDIVAIIHKLGDPEQQELIHGECFGNRPLVCYFCGIHCLHILKLITAMLTENHHMTPNLCLLTLVYTSILTK
jgi:hypothetical protein